MTTRVRTLLIALAFWAAGMMMAHGPMLFSGFSRVQHDRADSRLMQYMLEHGYRWVTGDPAHARFWDAPIFHPVPNATAWSETMIGTGPAYWVWRLVGFPRDLAYALWLLTVSTLNFTAAFLLLHRALGRSPAASGVGAFLFSFASLRLAHLGHPQLLAGFYLAVFLHAVIRVFGSPTRKAAGPWIAVAAAAFAAQVYSCFYVGWFLAFATGLAFVWSLALPSLRTPALNALRLQGPGLAAGIAGAGLALLPFILHSLRAAALLGYRAYDEVEMFLPRPQSCLYFGSGHWLYGWTSGASLFESLPVRTVEQVALGLVTPVLAAVGLWSGRTQPFARLLIAVGLTLFLCSLLLPGGASLWGLAYSTVPGARAIRAVGRVSFLLLLPLSAGVAAWIDASKRPRILVAILALLAMIEQGRSTPTLDRQELRDSTAAIVRCIDPKSSAFLYSAPGPRPASSLLEALPLRVHLDAMMASLDSGVPTINGYSGGTPPGWLFDSATEDNAGEFLKRWCDEQRLEGSSVQWIRGAR